MNGILSYTAEKYTIEEYKPEDKLETLLPGTLNRQ